VVAPHGGGIEPGTSEIADGIADEELSLDAFEGLKSNGNKDLHITSTRFDEPTCLILIGRSDVVVTIHGENSEADGEGVFLGGLDDDLGPRVRTALDARGFDVLKQMFSSLTREGRTEKTQRFRDFIDALRGSIAGETQS